MIEEWNQLIYIVFSGSMTVPQILEGLFRALFVFLITGFTLGMLLWSIYLRTGWKSLLLLLVSPLAWVFCGYRRDYRSLLLRQGPAAYPTWLGNIEAGQVSETN